MMRFMRVIGIHIFEEGIRMARASHGEKGMRVRGKAEMTFEKGMVHKGVVVRTEEAGALLRSVLSKVPALRAKKAVLCLPVEQVFATTLTVQKAQRALIELEIARWMPDDVHALTYAFHVLRKGVQGTDIAVIAIRKDILESDLALCRAAGFRVIGITTVSHALRSALPVTHRSTMLMSVGITFPTITLFRENILLDEAVLPVEADAATMLREAEALAAEYWERFPAQDVFVSASSDMVERVQAVLFSQSAAEKNQKKKAVSQDISWCTLHPVFQEVRQENLPYLGALCASVTRGSVFRQRRRFGRLVVLIAALGASLLLVGAAVAVQSYSPWWQTMGLPSETVSLMTEEEGETVLPNLATDVPADHAVSTALAWALEQGLFETDASGAFSPDRVMLRFEFLQLLIDETADVDIRAITERSGYDDVSAVDPFLPHVRYAAQQGIISGTLFRPYDSVTVAEALKMAFVAFGVTVDAPSEGEQWYDPYLRRMRENRIFSDDSLTANTPVTRSMAAQLFMFFEG